MTSGQWQLNCEGNASVRHIKVGELSVEFVFLYCMILGGPFSRTKLLQPMNNQLVYDMSTKICIV